MWLKCFKSLFSSVFSLFKNDKHSQRIWRRHDGCLNETVLLTLILFSETRLTDFNICKSVQIKRSLGFPRKSPRRPEFDSIIMQIGSKSEPQSLKKQLFVVVFLLFFVFVCLFSLSPFKRALAQLICVTRMIVWLLLLHSCGTKATREFWTPPFCHWQLMDCVLRWLYPLGICHR